MSAIQNGETDGNALANQRLYIIVMAEVFLLQERHPLMSSAQVIGSLILVSFNYTRSKTEEFMHLVEGVESSGFKRFFLNFIWDDYLIQW